MRADRPRRGSGLSSRSESWWLIVLGAIFVIGGLIAAWSMFLGPTVSRIASRGWIETPCVIVSSDLEKSRGRRGRSTYRVAIRYAYRWEGRPYEGTRYDFTVGSTNAGVERMRAAVAANPVGRNTTCLINPFDPSESVFTRELPPTIWFWAMFLVGPIVGGMSFWYGWRGLAKPVYGRRVRPMPKMQVKPQIAQMGADPET